MLDAAEHFVQARQTGSSIQRLPEHCRPANIEEALAVQLRVIDLLKDEIGGWRCTVPQGDRISIAPLPASTICGTAPCRIYPNVGVARIEPEIAVVLGKDLTPRTTTYTESDVRDAIAETHLVLEIIGSRYVDSAAVPYPEFLADSLSNQGLFVGPAVPDPLNRPLEFIKIDVRGPSGSLLTRDGRHPNGHPLRPLTWIANFLTSRGMTLKAGQVVTTGSYAGVLEVPFDVPLSVQFAGLGDLSVRFV